MPNFTSLPAAVKGAVDFVSCAKTETGNRATTAEIRNLFTRVLVSAAGVFILTDAGRTLRLLNLDGKKRVTKPGQSAPWPSRCITVTTSAPRMGKSFAGL